MKKAALLFFSLIMCVMKMHAQEKLPHILVKTLDGKEVDISSVIDTAHPTFISFWATWCKPCRQELDAISEDMDEFNATGAKLIAISIDDSRSMADVNSVVNGNGWNFDVYIDDNQNLKRALNIFTVPHSIVLNKKGEIVKHYQGYTAGQETQLFQFLKTLK
jgi:thiol-disulfide isomerase/thioredoxin